jgi:hypothetical protein
MRGGDAEHDPEVMNDISARSSLSPLPRHLFDLWQEHVEGIGGRKAARYFSFIERGYVKHKFHCREIVWYMISGLTKQGVTANSAINLIHNVYGQQTSVTHIINGVRRAIKNGNLNPNLRF